MSSFSSAVKAFVLAFIYHFFCEFFLSHANTIPFALVWLAAFPLVVSSLFVSEEFLAGIISGLPGAVAETVIHYLLDDFIAACEDRIIVTPAPAPVPVIARPPAELHTIPLSVVLENLYRVDTPVPVEVEEILPALYPASFPRSPVPTPSPTPVVRTNPGFVRKVRICCLPMFDKKF
ncbi:hypothetical protein L873DRAFT_1295378 [Choiromyces venosus 120613-1]|uniref:Uncharacterized protein n=1 Tax=Choiromyces venosus 120613-1 TaxID=1336337 RepID=A0A3N4JH03_9PEZI|nr:hypothetical protein L873DRAFT_1792078 [Choiromyces venosus 120613-1]RPA95683.1 hypothetical protein L873DRAFT_1295378 [Choiromyces venosus 120613-1]